MLNTNHWVDGKMPMLDSRMSALILGSHSYTWLLLQHDSRISQDNMNISGFEATREMITDNDYCKTMAPGSKKGKNYWIN